MVILNIFCAPGHFRNEGVPLCGSEMLESCIPLKTEIRPKMGHFPLGILSGLCANLPCSAGAVQVVHGFEVENIPSTKMSAR